MAPNSVGESVGGLFSQKIEQDGVRARERGISRDRAAGDENFLGSFLFPHRHRQVAVFHGSNVGLFQGEIKGFQVSFFSLAFLVEQLTAFSFPRRIPNFACKHEIKKAKFIFIPVSR